MSRGISAPGSTGSRSTTGTPTIRTSTSSSAAAPTTVRTWSSAANTSAAVFAIARPSASRWSLVRAASRRSARRSSGRSEADRWTSLDRALRDISDECGGVADLRPGPDAEDPELRRLLLGRAAKLERLGLADPVGPACWTLKPGLEPALAPARHPRRHHQDHAPGHERRRARAGRQCLCSARRGAVRSGARPTGQARSRRRAQGHRLRDRRRRRWPHPSSQVLRSRDDRRCACRGDRRGAEL